MSSTADPATKGTLWKNGLVGLDLPLDHWKATSNQHLDMELLPTPLRAKLLEDGYCCLPILTLRELAMLDIMNSVTDKPGWETKVFDDTIAEKWKAEAITTEGADVTPVMMDYVIDELRWKADCFKKTGAVVVYNGDVVKSDSAIPVDLKALLKAGVEKLAALSAKNKDYHPGSNNQVLDLVHPSLFPLIYGRSRILEACTIGVDDCIDNIGKGSQIKDQADFVEAEAEARRSWFNSSEQSSYSRNYQWLPCEVAVDDGKARIASYINNLHPHKHQDLYKTIGDIITRTIPLWNLTLDALGDQTWGTRIVCDSISFDPDPEDIKDEDKPPQGEDEDEDDYWDRIQEWEDEIRKTVQPEAGLFSAPSTSDKTPYNLFECKDGLQIIVKLANIELNTKNPEYAGGTWHVEGQLNEHICATALYYYDNVNITDSYLAFRQQVSPDDINEMNYPQSVHGWVTELYGLDPEGPTAQQVGSVLCKEDRLLTFPNVLQHQVQPFKLADPTKPGHRKILALFLVDPSLKVISTAHIPPQQREWWEESIDKTLTVSETRLGLLSNELMDQVMKGVGDFPITLEEAKEIRLKLMDERKVFKTQESTNFESNSFSLCEH